MIIGYLITALRLATKRSTAVYRTALCLFARLRQGVPYQPSVCGSAG